MEKLTLSSPVFSNGDEIPKKYGYKFENSSPPLTINHVPNGTNSLALIMDDPDAKKAVGKLWVHWVVWNISPSVNVISENNIPVEAIEGITDFGQIGYGGPAPPDQQHTYYFKLFALDTKINLSKGSSKYDLEKAMQNHILADATLTGTFTP